MVIPLLANQDLTPMLKVRYWQNVERGVAKSIFKIQQFSLDLGFVVRIVVIKPLKTQIV